MEPSQAPNLCHINEKILKAYAPFSRSATPPTSARYVHLHK